MSESVWVRCRETRHVGEDLYLAGNDYVMTRTRADRYAAYFRILRDVADDPDGDQARIPRPEHTMRNRTARVGGP